MKTTKKILSRVRSRRMSKSRAAVIRSGATEIEMRRMADLRQRGASAATTRTSRARGTLAKPTLRLRTRSKSGRLVPPENVEREVATLRRIRDRDERSTPSGGAARKTALGG